MGGGYEPGEDDPFDGTDAEVLSQVAALFDAVDPVPAGLAERLTFVLQLDNVESELATMEAELTEPVGARGAERVRTVTFASDSLTVMVTITAAGPSSYRLDGWLAPAGALRTELKTARGPVRETAADADGRFEFDDVPAGLAQLVVHPTDGAAVVLQTPVVTPAVEL